MPARWSIDMSISSFKSSVDLCVHKPHAVNARGHFVHGDTQAFALDIQMKLVVGQENAYWAVQFTEEPYYVAGRGYDQYQPAYALGWRTALEYPGKI